jgi:hypothetical protein
MHRDKDHTDNMVELDKAISALPPAKREIAIKLLRELEFLRTTLMCLKVNVTEKGVIINGVRSGKMENPALRSYNTTVQRYGVLYKQIVDLLPVIKEETPKDDLMEFVQAGTIDE